MAALIGLVTKPELQWIRGAGLEVVELSIASFCRLFHYDAGLIEPNKLVVFVNVPTTMYETTMLLMGSVETPSLKLPEEDLEPNTSA